jgi:hypothetical protein
MGDKIKINAAMLKALSVASTRASLATAIGQTFNGKRDVYSSCGWERSLNFTHYIQRWERDGIARRVVAAYPKAAWSKEPDVWDNEDEETESPFELRLKEVSAKTSLWANLEKLEIRGSVGRYGCLFLGLNDGAPLDQPVTKRKSKLELLYVHPLFQDQAIVSKWDDDPTSERFGKPVLYTVQFSDEAFLTTLATTTANNSTMQVVSGVQSPNAGGPLPVTTPRQVHWSRMVHVATDEPEGTALGFSRLHAPYNLLQDIEKAVGSMAEGYWKSSIPGMSIEAADDVEFDLDDTEMNDEIENYTHDLTRVMRLRGATAKNLSPNLAEPRGTFDVQIDVLAIITEIPKRLLLGNEAGELASSQDMTTWINRVKAYRKRYTIPCVIIPTLKALIRVGVLPVPKTEIKSVEPLPKVEWPEKEEHTDVERADIAGKRVTAINQYVSGGANQMIPPLSFLTDELGIEQKTAQMYLDEVQKAMLEEQIGGLDMGGSIEDGELMGEASDLFGYEPSAEDVDGLLQGESDTEDTDEEDEESLQANAFDESKVKRDEGKFSSTGGSGKDSADPAAQQAESDQKLKDVRTAALHATATPKDQKQAAAAYVLLGRAIKTIDTAETEGRTDPKMARAIRSQLETRQKAIVSQWGKEASETKSEEPKKE